MAATGAELAESLHRVFGRLRDAMLEAQSLMDEYERQVEVERAVAPQAAEVLVPEQEDFGALALADCPFGGGDVPVGEGPVEGSTGARSRSRSRRRQGVAPEEPRCMSLEDRLTHMALDEDCRRSIAMFADDVAVQILDQVAPCVRNVSSFVSAMCDKLALAYSEGGVTGQLPDAEKVEALIVDLHLDDVATRAIQSMPAEQALEVLNKVDTHVRNPSAFIIHVIGRSAKKGERGGQKGGGGNMGGGVNYEEMIRDRTSGMNLDATAMRALAELPPAASWAILESMDEDIRNPSAFVTAEARKACGLAGGSRAGDGGGRHRVERTPHHVAPPVPGAGEDIVNTIDSLAQQLNLDETCINALHSTDAQSAVDILKTLATDLNTIRNRSAFVIAEVKRRRTPGASAFRSHEASGGQQQQQRTRGGANRAPVHAGGPVSSVPCKFFQEGRCKNGPECRFSHST